MGGDSTAEARRTHEKLCEMSDGSLVISLLEGGLFYTPFLAVGSGDARW